MGFYGNLTAPLKTKFEFDRIYSSKVVMDARANNDEVFVGRFVLVNYEHYDYLWVNDNGVFLDSEGTVFTADESNSAIGQTYINGFTNHLLWQEDYDKFPRIGATALTQNAKIKEDDVYNFNLWLDTKSEYSKNFIIKRNYNKTIWQKVYNDQLGEQQYVLIADLGSIVASSDYDGLMSTTDKAIFDSNRIFNINLIAGDMNKIWSFDTAKSRLTEYLNAVLETVFKEGDSLIFRNSNSDWEHYILSNVEKQTWTKISHDKPLLASSQIDGLMRKEDKIKLDAIKVLNGEAVVDSRLKVVSNTAAFAPSFTLEYNYGEQKDDIIFKSLENKYLNFTIDKVNDNNYVIDYNLEIRSGVITTPMFDWEKQVPNTNNEQYKDENGLSFNAGDNLKRQFVKIPVTFTDAQKMKDGNYMVLISYMGYKPCYDISIDTRDKNKNGFSIVVGRDDTTLISTLTIQWMAIPYQSTSTASNPTVYYE